MQTYIAHVFIAALHGSANIQDGSKDDRERMTKEHIY